MLVWLNNVDSQSCFLLVAGACGGFASFLFACKRGTIRNNRHCRKAFLEVAGGSVVGFFVSLPLGNSFQIPLAFFGGVGWSAIINVARKKITDVIEAAFFGPLTRRRDDEDGG